MGVADPAISQHLRFFCGPVRPTSTALLLGLEERKMSQNRYHGIDAYTVRLITFKAKQLTIHPGFSDADREDVEQELLLDLLRRQPKYDPERAQNNTFVARVIEHRAATLIEERTAGLRDYRLQAFSLNDQIEDEDGGCCERSETFDQDDYLLRTGRQARSSEELRDLGIDVRTVVDGLPDEMRSVCRRLMHDSVTDVSRDTGVPRSTLYGIIGKVRAAFKDAGLEDYF
ncbi:RNA polymerase subunit sigma-24 [Solidesulfovibrio sp.]|uniref:RNA polymerase subunit sigma-24 n=1 Tax=Solidesulfovibrio sp. TaxID=2910990 RepID=UPI002B1EFAD8|nr:RNA polymerase subunit sigma-24 [Solidesulfovibrio sp.]MEA5087808.1 RNA polymerase subunit sigma-24 [Solidesulfovibrio sp.]